MKPSERKADSPTLRVFGLLQMIVRADKPVSLSDAVSALGQPKPTVHRMFALLEEAGLVIREPDGKRYSPSRLLVRFGLEILMNPMVRGVRRAILQRLVHDIGETCNLTVLDGTDVIYLDRVEADWPLRIDLRPGSRVPLHCSASGKLLLSQYPPSKRRALLENLVLQRCTQNTVTDVDLLEAELDRTCAKRVGMDNEEYMAGLVCVAVPVVDDEGRFCAAIALQAPVARLPLARALEHLPSLQAAARAMAETLAVPSTDLNGENAVLNHARDAAIN
jgi:IclR family acetate operon transcriptional repressor